MPAPDVCWLCERPLGGRTEWHHTVPRAKGGRETVPLHPICHRAIHTNLGNGQLARMGADIAAVRGDASITQFLKWIQNKAPDFHAPTKRKRSSSG